MFKYHIFALLLGTILEIFLGRLYSCWNPFDSIRNWVKFLDRALLGDELILLEPSKQKSFGIWLLVLTLLPVFVVVTFFTLLCYEISPVIGIIFEAIATYLCLDANYTYYTAKGIMAAFYGDGVEAMRNETQVFTKVDTDDMDEEQLTQLTITKVANEAGDSSVSAIVAMFLFGPVGGFCYRTLDLIDEIVGHKDSRYEHFGYYPAKLNRFIDYIPGGFSGWLAVVCARHTFGDFNGRNARYIHLRDKNKAISAFAGALEISLKNGTVGDQDKTAKASQIRGAITLLRNMFIFCQCILLILLLFF